MDFYNSPHYQTLCECSAKTLGYLLEGPPTGTPVDNAKEAAMYVLVSSAFAFVCSLAQQLNKLYPQRSILQIEVDMGIPQELAEKHQKEQEERYDAERNS